MLRDCSGHVADALRLCRDWKNAEQVLRHVREVTRLEGEVDRAARDCDRALFANPPDPVQLIKWRELYEVGVIVLFIFVAPLIGMAFGYVMITLVTLAFRRSRPRRVDKVFRRGQLLSAALYSLGHGGNDAQKTMGIIFALLIADSHQGQFEAPAQVPVEVVLACHLAMGLGTLAGGWRIIHTMGQRLIRLRSVDGFCSEVGAAITLALTVFWGIPVSTTHTIAGSIVGVGFLRRWKAVRWGVARDVVWAWVLTIPGAALVAAVSWWLLAPLAGLLAGSP